MEWPFLAIPNLYQSFWEKLSEKDWNKHFSPFLIYTSSFGKNCQKKIGTTIFWPFLIYTSLLQKNCWKKIQNGHYWPFQIYTSLSGKHCQKKIGTNIFGHSKFIPVFLGKIVGKNLEQPFLAIPNLYQSFWEKLSEKDWNKHFSPFLIYTSSFGKNSQKKIGTTIFGHS